MDMSAAEVKRAALAPQGSATDEPNGSEILVRCHLCQSASQRSKCVCAKQHYDIALIQVTEMTSSLRQPRTVALAQWHNQMRPFWA